MSSDANTVRQNWHAARLAPLWESPSAHRQLDDFVESHVWRWQDVRPLIDLAFQQTSPAAVQRRVLQMISPRAQSMADEFTCGNVLAAFQCLLPGETARPHRHTMNALRFMLEGSGVITRVDGKDCPMEFGDLVLTPGMTWHEHYHHGSEPVVWLDVLDVPLHVYLGTGIFEPGPIVVPPKTIPDAAFSAPNIVPCLPEPHDVHSPVFRYPYQDAVRALQHAPAGADGIRRVRYVNPLTGQSAIPLLECSMWELSEGAPSTPARSNANLVVAVVEGRGESTVGNRTFVWEKRDVFTVPQHNWASHRALSGDARLFVVSDADVLRRLNLLREEIQA